MSSVKPTSPLHSPYEESLEPSDTFLRRHVGVTEETVTAMLSTIGYKELDDLINDAVPENKRVAVMDAVLKASGCKPGQGDKPNIRLLGDMGMLFLDFHLEGMAIPRTCGDKRHLKDGRLMDLLEQHGRLKDTTEASTKHNKRLMTKAANEILPAILAVINADS